MTITQINCDSDNRAPPGCLQYMYGLDRNPETNKLEPFGIIKSFNFEGGYHLSDQNQLICIRREQGFCAICYAQVDFDKEQDFGISGGKRRVCTYYRSRYFSGGEETKEKNLQYQSTCNQGATVYGMRDESLMTNTGFIRGSFEQCGGY